MPIKAATGLPKGSALIAVASVIIPFTACNRRPRSDVEWRSAKLSVSIEPRKPNGKPWDVSGSDELPDVAVCVSYGSARSCYPGAEKAVKGAACLNGLRCELPDIQVPAQEAFEVEVWDVDIAAHDRVCTLQCSVGKTCEAKSCTVTVGDTSAASERVAAADSSNTSPSSVGATESPHGERPESGDEPSSSAVDEGKKVICPEAAKRARARMRKCGLNTAGFTPAKLCASIDYDRLSYFATLDCPEIERLLFNRGR